MINLKPREDKIICDYSKVNNAPKTVPIKLVVGYSVTSFRFQLVMGVICMTFPAIIFYKLELNNVILAIIITSLTGLFLIYTAFQKKADHNYILDKTGITINGEFVYWHEIEQAVKLIPKKKNQQHEFLRLKTKLKNL